jgi:hypothetical protein
MRVVVKDHFGKAIPLARALSRAGHELTPINEVADLLLIDLDDPHYGYQRVIDAHKAAGATVLLYPHGACPMLTWDGMYEPSENVDGNLVIGTGHAEVMRRYGYPSPIHVIGWSLCERAPFRAAPDVRRVLYAPTHPSGHGHLTDVERELNARHYEALLAGPWELTVRHIGTLEQNGLWEADGVRYSRGDYTIATDDIDAADVVVAAPGTFPALTVARGTPMVTYGQGLEPTYGLPGEPVVTLRHLDLYERYMRYPFDIENGPLDEVLHAAARSEAPIADWKRRFIGDQMDDAATAELIERIVAGRLQPLTVDESRGHVVAAFADELLERPELLRTYARHVGPDDDATLLIWGPGQSADAVLAHAEQAIAAAGIDEHRLPDIALLPFPGAPDSDRRLAEIADSLLSEWPAAGRLGELPRYAPAALADAA